MPTAHLEAAALDPSAALNAFLQRNDGDGAVVSFVGVVRNRNRDGLAVTGLHLDHYPIVTERSLETIVANASRKFEISDAMVVHRCGFVAAGDPIVFAAAAAPHRRVAFLATDYLMDMLKTEAVFWKREDSEGPAQWIEPSDLDCQDRDRWFSNARD